MFEYRRSSEKDEAKAEAAEREKTDLYRRIMDLELGVDRQNAEIREEERVAKCFACVVKNWPRQSKEFDNFVVLGKLFALGLSAKLMPKVLEQLFLKKF
jgi:hypothetical protein